MIVVVVVVVAIVVIAVLLFNSLFINDKCSLFIFAFVE